MIKNIPEVWKNLYNGNIPNHKLLLETKNIWNENMPASLMADMVLSYQKARFIPFKDLVTQWQERIKSRDWFSLDKESRWFSSQGKDNRLRAPALLAHRDIPRGVVGPFQIMPAMEEKNHREFMDMKGKDLPDSIQGVLQNSKKSAILAIQRLLHERWKEPGWSIIMEDPLPWFEIEGQSMTWTLTALFWCFLSHTSVPRGVAFTGDWDDKGNASQVCYLDKKIHALLCENAFTSSRIREIWVPSGISFQEKSITQEIAVAEENYSGESLSFSETVKIIPIPNIEKFCARLVPDWQKILPSVFFMPWAKCLSSIRKIEEEYLKKADIITNEPLQKSYIEPCIRLHFSGSDGSAIQCLSGPSGSGKTSFCKKCAFDQAQAYLERPQEERLPITIRLSEIHESLLDRIKNELEIEREELPKVAGRLKLYLDDMDEVEEKFMDDMQQSIGILQKAGAHILLTHRDYFFCQKFLCFCFLPSFLIRTTRKKNPGVSKKKRGRKCRFYPGEFIGSMQKAFVPGYYQQVLAKANSPQFPD